MGDPPAGAVPVVLGTVTVRGQTWQGFQALTCDMDDVDWKVLAEAAERLADQAKADCRERGLPAPKAAAWRYRGAWATPVHEPVP